MSWWQLLLSLLGGFLLLQIVVGILLGRSIKNRRNRRFDYPTIELEPIELKNGVMAQFYMEGHGLYDDMLAAMEQATETIYFETYNWRDDEVGNRFREKLIARARVGVAVFVIYDFFGTVIYNRNRLKFPDLPNLHVLPFIAVTRPRHLLNLHRYAISHRKTLTVDDEIGFIGGFNIGENYGFDWRDSHVRLDGEGARALNFTFSVFWNDYRGKHQPKLPLPEWPWRGSIEAYHNDPRRYDYPIRSRYLAAIERAQKQILITNAYFIPDGRLREAIYDAADRGVDVCVLLPWHSNQVYVDWVARHSFEGYLQRGVRIFAYERTMIHAKTMTIDGAYSIIGSANLDRLSLRTNHEADVEIYSEEVAHCMEAIFACDLQNAREIVLKRWQQRPWRMKASEWVLAPLWPLL